MEIMRQKAIARQKALNYANDVIAEKDAYIAGLESANGHLSKLCDEQRSALQACVEALSPFDTANSFSLRSWIDKRDSAVTQAQEALK